MSARACPARGGLPEFEDPAAARLTAQLGVDGAAVAADASLVRGIVLRTQYFDRSTLRFFARNPDGMAVVLGAGLCTRLSRLAGKLPAHPSWINVDLPEVCALREQFMPCATGERNVACSALDLQWLDLARLDVGRPVLILLEGVCPYLAQEPLQELLFAIADHCARQDIQGTLVLDFVHPALLERPMQAGGMELTLSSSFERASEIADLHPALTLLEQQHPYAEFSVRHRHYATAFAELWGQQPYTMASYALGR